MAFFGRTGRVNQINNREEFALYSCRLDINCPDVQ